MDTAIDMFADLNAFQSFLVQAMILLALCGVFELVLWISTRIRISRIKKELRKHGCGKTPIAVPPQHHKNVV